MQPPTRSLDSSYPLTMLNGPKCIVPRPGEMLVNRRSMVSVLLEFTVQCVLVRIQTQLFLMLLFFWILVRYGRILTL